jgi:hypothetical protein
VVSGGEVGHDLACPAHRACDRDRGKVGREQKASAAAKDGRVENDLSQLKGVCRERADPK